MPAMAPALVGFMEPFMVGFAELAALMGVHLEGITLSAAAEEAITLQQLYSSAVSR